MSLLPSPPATSRPARGVDPERRARARQLAQRIRPVALDVGRPLPVAAPLADLFPGGAPTRGATLEVAGPPGQGATLLALALLGAPTAAGEWVAVLGAPEVGLAAAGGVGVDLTRLLVVDDPGPDRWATAVDALLGAVAVVLVVVPPGARPAQVRRLAARARERGTTMVGVRSPAGAWLPEVRLDVRTRAWEGVAQGHGHLQARRVHVRVDGRRGASRPTGHDLWLPDHQGHLRPVVDAAPRRPLVEREAADGVVALRRVG